MKQKLLVGILILAMIGFVLPSILRSVSSFNDKPETKSPATPLEKASEPTFKDEGDLFFLRNSDTLASIDIEVADTEAQRQRGLMYRSSMKADGGMLFIFDELDTLSFWMRNTYIPLDLLFLDSDQKIVQISPNAPAYSTKSIPCLIPAKYVVEVNGRILQTTRN